jgi:hypothetical protein
MQHLLKYGPLVRAVAELVLQIMILPVVVVVGLEAWFIIHLILAQQQLPY